ncbi:MAG: NADP-dependent oxidoreductase [Pseudomarimonas sp.]
MRAAYLTGYGGPEKLVLGELPEPVPGPLDLLVQVAGASINPVDFKIRQGKLKSLMALSFPAVLGNDLSGTVLAVGSAVRNFKPGDQVVARLGKDRIGAFAERALVAQSDAALAPASIDLVDAAGLPLAGLTAWQALFEYGRLEAGQHLLVHAGAGGVGHLALQLGRWKGAKVSTTASSRNRARCIGWGADLVVDHHSQKFEQRIEPVDVALDTLGGEVLRRTIKHTRVGGRVISIAALPTPQVMREWGGPPALAWVLTLLTWRERALARSRDVEYRYLFMRPDGAGLAKLVELVDADHLEVVIERRYPLSEALAAMAHVESGRTVGKVVLVP